MDGGSLATLGGITELVPRMHAARARLASLAPHAAASALEALLAFPRRHDAGVLLACGLALLEGEITPLREAAAECAPRAALYLADAPPHRALAVRGRLPDVGLLEEARSSLPRFVVEREPIFEKVYTGESFPNRNWSWEVVGYETECVPIKIHPRFYAQRRRELVARGVRHPSATYLARLLRSPDFLPGDALSIAVRRPLNEAIARALLAHAPAISRLDVRLALALNPFTPTRIALLLVPTVRPHLRTVVRANVHPLVRALARSLAGARSFVASSN